MRRLATIGVLLLIVLGVTAAAPLPLPRLVLWAWERPEDLRYADPAKVEIAFVAASIRLIDNQVMVTPRFQALQLPDNARSMPVIHVEARRGDKPSLDAVQRERFVAAILRALSNLQPAEIQIDFEALPSQQEFYAAALADLRQRLSAGTRLSITALASWCMYENWTAMLPVDEIVPMLFRMGRISAAQYAIDGGGDFRQSNCHTALGVSTDEKRQRLPSGRRIYVFNPHSWNERSYAALLQESQSWR